MGISLWFFRWSWLLCLHGLTIHQASTSFTFQINNLIFVVWKITTYNTHVFHILLTFSLFELVWLLTGLFFSKRPDCRLINHTVNFKLPKPNNGARITQSSLLQILAAQYRMFRRFVFIPILALRKTRTKTAHTKNIWICWNSQADS